MEALTFTKTGAKAGSSATLDEHVFGVPTDNHELLRHAYAAYLANGRVNLASTKTRGQVSGGGKKPWRQKGTGRARVGSSRVPQWRGGGVAFGPTGKENYTIHLTTAVKRRTLCQAFSMAAQANKIRVVDSLDGMPSKTKTAVTLLQRLDAHGRVLLLTGDNKPEVKLAFRNIPDVILARASFSNVYDILNSDAIVIERNALEMLVNWLTPAGGATSKKRVSA